MNDLQEKILKLKKERNALILAHYYQTLPVQDIADFVGDSFALAKLAQKADKDMIILCGVRFMAESAKILNPEKTVYLPSFDAGCPMADMITPDDVLSLRKKHPEAAVVCYVNSSAAVKAVSDICCTSSSAEKVVRSLPNRQIIFVPDKNLGSYVAKSVPEKEIILFDGCCPIHDNVSVKDAETVRKTLPDAKILVHPECRSEVLEFADYIGSTAGILDYARKTDALDLVIGTEYGVFDILSRELLNKKLHILKDNFVCADMKKTGLEDILACFEGNRPPIELPESEMAGARKSLERMVGIE
ncbi:MAG: quinolinate synthase [Firmicutes bacterium HGW-Firmicutes-16]|nr:MAG: quinolinate synthase [Firmicutes bacterium HGW-Firmicutes-16]